MEIPEWGLSLPECCALGDREFVDVAVSVVWLKRTANMLGGFAPLFIVLEGFCPNVGMCDIVKRAKLEQDHPIFGSSHGVW